MFRLVPSIENQRELERLSLFFGNLGLRIGSRERDEIGEAVRQGFARNFQMEGSADGSWAALRPATQAQRQMLGFPPARPILYRTGSLFDSFVAGAHPQHYTRTSQSSGLYAQEEGSDDIRAARLQQGDPASNLMGRSVVALDSQSEQHVGDVIHDLLIRLMRQDGL